MEYSKGKLYLTWNRNGYNLIGWMTISFIVILFHVIGTRVSGLLPLISIAEYMICFVCLVLRQYKKAFLLFNVFLANTLEVQYFVTGIREMDGTFYSLIHMPRLSMLPMLAFCGLVYLILVSKYGYSKIHSMKKSGLLFLHRSCHYMLIVGLVMTMILYILNDNGVCGLSWYIEMALKHTVRILVIFFVAESSILLIVNDSEFSTAIDTVLKACFYSLPIAGFVCAIMGFTGYRGIVTNLSILPIYSSLGVYLIIFYKYQENMTDRITSIFFSALLLLYFIIYPSQMGGKFVLTLFLAALFIFYIRSKKGAIIFAVVVVAGAFVVLETNIFETIFKDNDFMIQKIKEAKSLFAFSITSGISGQDANVAFRFDEIANVAMEYAEKPYYLLFGKGIGATTLAHTNRFSWSDVASFTSEQVNSGVFTDLHESINVIFLKFGLAGLYGFFVLIGKMVKSIRVSAWSLIGLTWFVFYFGIYYSMLIGMIAMVFALYQNDIYLQDSKMRNG